MESRARRYVCNCAVAIAWGYASRHLQGTWAVPFYGHGAAGGPLCEAWYYCPIDWLTALRYTDDGVKSCS